MIQVRLSAKVDTDKTQPVTHDRQTVRSGDFLKNLKSLVTLKQRR